MAAVGHPEFAKIAIVVTRPISACDSRLRLKFRITRPIRRRDIGKNDFQYGVRPPSWICKISTFSRDGNSHPHIKFDRNRIIHGWTIEIKLFSKWRPSAILNFRKLPSWSSDIYPHGILHLQSKFRINRPIWRRDIAKKRFSIWRPSAILNLQNFDFSNAHAGNGNLHLSAKFDPNWII